MKTPLLTGIIDRRILLNFRADPAVVNKFLPSPFRAQLVRGQAMVGICLIRLKQERLKGMPDFLGLTSENGAHRFAVQWDEAGQAQQGVYIPRRDTSSRINTLAGNQYWVFTITRPSPCKKQQATIELLFRAVIKRH